MNRVTNIIEALNQLKNPDTSSESDSDEDGEEEEVSEEEEDESGLFIKRLGNCEVCAAKPALYTCPKCEVKTCSLNCCKIHKKELNCDGIRDRTKFVYVKNMTDRDYRSDYYFLEECTRYTEDRKQDRVKNLTYHNRKLPTHLFHLKKACIERNIKINFLNSHFTRRKENSSHFNWKVRKIFWHVQWIFVNAGNAVYTAKKCDEDKPLVELLDKYVNPDNVEDVPKKHLLACYHSYDVNDMQILLKAEGIARSQSRYFLLDPSKSLKENLRSKTIIEYPTILVTYEKDSEAFDIIDSDEDIEEEMEQHRRNLERIRNEILERERKANEEGEDFEANESEAKQLTKLIAERQNAERKRKLEEYEQTSNNFLFSDNKLIDTLLSSSEDEDKVAEKKTKVE